MSRFPQGPTIPPSGNFESSYSDTLKFHKLMNGIITIENGIISGLSDPISNSDAVSKGYMNTVIGSNPIFNTITANRITTSTLTGLVLPTNNSDAANKEYVDSVVSNPGAIQYQVVVQKNPIVGQYLTIESAIASISDASSTKPYCVVVGPGLYFENQLDIPAYVSIKGESMDTTIVSPNIPNQYLFNMNNNTEISFMTLKGIDGSVSPGAGTGYPAVYCEDVGESARMHKISIYDYDIGIENYSSPSATKDSKLYIEYTSIYGNYTYGIKNRSGTISTGFVAFTSMEDSLTYPSASSVKTAIINDGVNTSLELISCSLVGDTGMRGINLKNGGTVNITNTILSHFDNTGIYSENTGAGQVLRIDSCTFASCTLDFSIQNADTSGFFFGNSPRINHFINTGSSFFIAGVDNNLINVSKKGGDYTSIKEAVDAISDSSSSNPYVIRIGPGIFVENTITLKEGIFLVGSMTGGTIISPTASTNTIIVGVDGALIRDLFLTGASGTNGKGVYLEGTTGAGMLIRDCGFSNNYIQVHAHGSSATTVAIVDRCSVTGNMNTGFLATNVSSVITRLTLSNVTYQDLTIPVCTYFAYAAGTNVLLTCQTILIRTYTPSSSIAFYIDNGVEARITDVVVKGFDKVLYIPSGGTTSTVYLSSIIYSNITGYLIDINNSTTLGYWDSQYDYDLVNIPDNCPFFISNTDSTIITVQKSGGDFTSVADALNAITDATTNKRYIIRVGPGRFFEPEIVMKEYVSIHGSGRSTAITPDSANHHIIRGCNFAELVSMIITGAGVGYAGIYQETATGTINNSLICRQILFGLNDTHVWTYGNVAPANVILYNSRYGANATFNYGFKATNNNNSVSSKINIIGTTSENFTSPLPKYIGYASGENCSIVVNGFNAINDNGIEANTVGFQVDNGGTLRLLSCAIQGFETGIYAINSGTTPTIICTGGTIDCTTDINIDHPDTIGSIDASASRSKTIINGNPPITTFLVDPVAKGIIFSGPFYYSSTSYNYVTDISNLLTETPTMGLLSGGNLTTSSSALVLNISAGDGYNEDLSGILHYRTWSGTTLSLSPNTNPYVFINSNGIVASNTSYPSSVNNIILGQVSTDSNDIIYIQKAPLNSMHWSNKASNLFRNALGPIYSSGSQVLETGTRQLNVTQGVYYYSANEFTPGGGNPITFNIYYRSGTPGIYITITSQTTVPNGFYDDNSGTLVALTTSYYTKHLLCLLGGPSESYALIYGQAEYSSSSAAEAAGLPISPSFVTSAFVNVVSIVVQQGNANIVSFIDERPRVGFASSSVTGVITVHGDLAGLGANDHPQYLLVDGGAPGMLGDLDMNGNNIIAPGLYDGFNVSSHASRHAFNGADPLSPALAANISELSDSVAFAGINNTLIPRADHQHPHGNRGGGSLHALVTTSSAGFMSASDKTKLDGIASGATNTTASDNLPENVTKSSASAGVSSEVSRSDHKHDVSTSAPITTLLTSTLNAEGISTSLSRSDHTHAISTAVPVTQIPDQTNAIGNSTAFSRADHIHEIPSGNPVSLNANSTTSQGAASSFAISNHSHAIASGAPSNQSITSSTQVGTSVNFARADHIHTFSTGAPSNQTITSSTQEGVSTNFARADHIHTFSTGAPSNQTITSSTQEGVSTNFSRADHIHTFSTAVPVTIGLANSEGASTSFARADHVHNHGEQVGGTTHSLVVAGGSSGFMSGTDKTKLDGVETNATANPVSFLSLTNTITTASLTDVVITGTTLTPSAGNYVIMFNAGQVGNTNANRITTFSIYINGVLLADSPRSVANASTSSEHITIISKATVNGSEAIDIRWRVSANTSTVTNRTLTLIKTSS